MDEVHFWSLGILMLTRLNGINPIKRKWNGTGQHCDSVLYCCVGREKTNLVKAFGKMRFCTAQDSQSRDDALDRIVWGKPMTRPRVDQICLGSWCIGRLVCLVDKCVGSHLSSRAHQKSKAYNLFGMNKYPSRRRCTELAIPCPAFEQHPSFLLLISFVLNVTPYYKPPSFAGQPL